MKYELTYTLLIDIDGGKHEAIIEGQQIRNELNKLLPPERNLTLEKVETKITYYL